MDRRLTSVLAADMVGYSRLSEADAPATVAAHAALLKRHVRPLTAQHGGEIVKTTGDGWLAVFQGCVGAVECAIALQRALTADPAAAVGEAELSYRIGLTLGEVLFRDDDIFGNAVNIAARLEALSEPGGVVISDLVHQVAGADLPPGFADLGSTRIRNITRPLRIWQWTGTAQAEGAMPAAEAEQRVGFATSADGTQLAYATVGDGPCVLKAPNWMNHIDHDWRSPIYGPTFAALARDFRLVRFDQRGNGLSDWDVAAFTEDAILADMEAVVAAAGLDRFVLYGQSQGCAFSVRYAAAHPDRVRGLILLGGYARGILNRGSEEQAALHAATTELIRRGWGASDPAYRHLFTETLLPDGNARQKASMDQSQRLACSPENAARINEMNAGVDVRALARRITCPTLVLHCEGDRRIPMEEGRRLAGLIPGAEFVTLPGANHIVLEHTEAFDIYLERVREFVAALPDA